MKKLVCIFGVASLLAMGITGCGDDKDNAKTKSCDEASKPAATCTCNTTTGQWENCGSTTPKQCDANNKPSPACTCNTTTGQWENCGSTTPKQCDATNKPSPACTCNTTTGQWENCGGTTPKQCDTTNKPSPACTCNTTTGQWENCGSTTETCNENTFVEKCDTDGHTILYCDEGTVERYDCQEDYDEDGNPIKDTSMICAKSTSETENFVDCIFNTEDDKCDTVHSTSEECGWDMYYDLFEVKYTYSCIQFDNGQKYWYPANTKYCSNRCDDGCEVQTCEPNSAPSCSTNGLSLNCMEDNEGNWQILAEDCESYDEDYTCQIDEGFAECF